MNKSYMHTTIPFSHEYVHLLGIATYCYNYYEGTIVDILSLLDRSFRQKYYRELSLTSGQLKNEFNKIKANNSNVAGLEDNFSNFESLIDIRNRLIHSHPITDPNEDQILYYQSDVKKSVSDFKWTRAALVLFINDVNKFQSVASELLNSLR